jgi:hypothetical protein
MVRIANTPMASRRFTLHFCIWQGRGGRGQPQERRTNTHDKTTAAIIKTTAKTGDTNSKQQQQQQQQQQQHRANTTHDK